MQVPILVSVHHYNIVSQYLYFLEMVIEMLINIV